MENQKPNLSEDLIISLLVIWFVSLAIVFVMNSLTESSLRLGYGLPKGVTNEKPQYIFK